MVGKIRNWHELVISSLGVDDGVGGGKEEVDAMIGQQVGLELGQINFEGSVEPHRDGDGGDHLGDQSVEVTEGGPFDGQIPPTDVIYGFVVHHRQINMFQQAVGGQH
jgi:hypothetical protein